MSTSPTPVPSAADGQPLELLPDDAHALTVDEVGSLWSFLHGDIMEGETRRSLRASWGLCHRHSWGHAVVEIELWETGAGRRAGHQPFDLSILYEDLLDTMCTRLDAGRMRSRNAALRGEGECRICRDLRGPAVPGLTVGYAGFRSENLAKEAAPMGYTRSWMEETSRVWRDWVCPDCAEATGWTAGDALRCRPHLLQRGRADLETLSATVDKLVHLRSQIHRLIASMTQDGQPSAAEADASWVEALSWFHGWALPLALVAKQASD